MSVASVDVITFDVVDEDDFVVAVSVVFIVFDADDGHVFLVAVVIVSVFSVGTFLRVNFSSCWLLGSTPPPLCRGRSQFQLRVFFCWRGDFCRCGDCCGCCCCCRCYCRFLRAAS